MVRSSSSTSRAGSTLWFIISTTTPSITSPTTRVNILLLRKVIFKDLVLLLRKVINFPISVHYWTRRILCPHDTYHVIGTPSTTRTNSTVSQTTLPSRDNSLFSLRTSSREQFVLRASNSRGHVTGSRENSQTQLFFSRNSSQRSNCSRNNVNLPLREAS